MRLYLEPSLLVKLFKKEPGSNRMIELDLRELMRHKISLVDVTRKILADSEIVVASHDIYASDALHVATYSNVVRVKRLDAMLTDDKHFKRLGEIVKVLTLDEMSSSRPS